VVRPCVGVALLLAVPVSAQIRPRVLDTVSVAASVADMASTEYLLRPRLYQTDLGPKTVRLQEQNPLAKPFVAAPAPVYFASGLALDYGLLRLGRRMKQSNRAWERRTWWVPQALQSAAQFTFAVHNVRVVADQNRRMDKPIRFPRRR
jgi:hypothetical protein